MNWGLTAEQEIVAHSFAQDLIAAEYTPLAWDAARLLWGLRQLTDQGPFRFNLWTVLGLLFPNGPLTERRITRGTTAMHQVLHRPFRWWRACAEPHRSRSPVPPAYEWFAIYPSRRRYRTVIEVCDWALVNVTVHDCDRAAGPDRQADRLVFSLWQAELTPALDGAPLARFARSHPQSFPWTDSSLSVAELRRRRQG